MLRLFRCVRPQSNHDLATLISCTLFYRLIELQCMTLFFQQLLAAFWFSFAFLDFLHFLTCPLSLKLVQLHLMCAVHCVRNHFSLDNAIYFMAFFFFCCSFLLFYFVSVNWCFRIFPILFLSMPGKLRLLISDKISDLLLHFHLRLKWSETHVIVQMTNNNAWTNTMYMIHVLRFLAIRSYHLTIDLFRIVRDESTWTTRSLRFALTFKELSKQNRFHSTLHSTGRHNCCNFKIY